MQDKEQTAGNAPEKRKPGKLATMAIITAAACLALLLLSRIMFPPARSAAPASGQPDDGGTRDYWEEIDRSQEIAGAHRQQEAEPMQRKGTISDIIEKAFEDEDTLLLSIYPAPSYVSDDEDSLVYKKGIYKRTGYVEEKAPSADTIVVDGERYVKIDGLNPEHKSY